MLAVGLLLLKPCMGDAAPATFRMCLAAAMLTACVDMVKEGRRRDRTEDEGRFDVVGALVGVSKEKES